MSQLIALVATAVMVEGVRTIIQPGEPLPRLSKHDERELVQSGAAEDHGAKAAQEKADADAVAAAEADFAQARQRAQEEEEACMDATNDAKAKAAAKTATKK